jgi:hypothetical protein
VTLAFALALGLTEAEAEAEADGDADADAGAGGESLTGASSEGEALCTEPTQDGWAALSTVLDPQAANGSARASNAIFRDLKSKARSSWLGDRDRSR